MNPAVVKEIEELRGLSVGALRARYREVFGEGSRSHHKAFLFRRIAWRLQALAEGDLSDRARRRAIEIANDADLRVVAPKETRTNELVRLPASGARGPRLPQPGTLLTKRYRDQVVVVKVLDHGFEFDGRHYRSLSAIAREVTGTRWSGPLFFGLKRGKETRVA
jgi:hypothetical protein